MRRSRARLARRAAAQALAVLLVLPAWGCVKKAPPPRPAQPAPSPAVVAPPPKPPPPPAPGERELADAMSALRSGDDFLAVLNLEAVIEMGGKAPGRAEALFLRALLYARPDAEERNVPEARALLGEVLRSRPPIDRETEARLILSLLDIEETHANAILALREQMDLMKSESDQVRAALAQREEELRKIKEILLEKSPGR